FGVDSRNSEIEDWNGTWTGYYLKKFMDPAVEGQYYRNTNHWVELRYAEVLLNYAEALIELGGVANIEEGLKALNQVRNRAGLPGRVTADQTEARTFVRHERDIEFFGEGHHFWDIRRWKTAAGLLTNNSFYGTKIKEYVNGDMEWLLDYKNLVDNRSWGGDHFYWLPVPRDEVNKAPQLQQNPGYN
ncbi:MAG: RagB/SusD family nutrient uptake outer membrane protein, partial [Tannerella sp.]|nr:RagB/SusD family nutrient uptake outer membrane protein [Tannerella sp.]